MSMFQKATKRAVKARIALDGPSGSGKSFTALTWAEVFGKKTAAVDTERASLALYSDRFDFDVFEMRPPYNPKRLIEAIRDAEQAGYDTLVIDSLSHFWEGEGGVLDMVDDAAVKAHGNSYAGWKAGTPALRELIDAILASDLHIIATMRAKQEYVLEEDSRGKKVPKKVGMAPVMRAGVEYEFTLIGDLDLDHRLTISKSRASALADMVVPAGKAGEAAEQFLAWMSSGTRIVSREQVDMLLQRFRQIEPREIMVAAKRRFADEYGNPENLPVDRFEEALAFVNGYLDEPSPASAVRDHGVEAPAGSAVEPPQAATPPQPAAVPAAKPVTDLMGALEDSLAQAKAREDAKPVTSVKKLTRKEVDEVKKAAEGLDPTVLAILIFGQTDGDTDSPAGVLNTQLGTLLARIDAAKKGNLPTGYADVADRWAAWTEGTALPDNPEFDVDPGDLDPAAEVEADREQVEAGDR